MTNSEYSFFVSHGWALVGKRLQLLGLPNSKLSDLPSENLLLLCHSCSTKTPSPWFALVTVFPMVLPAIIWCRVNTDCFYFPKGLWYWCEITFDCKECRWQELKGPGSEEHGVCMTLLSCSKSNYAGFLNVDTFINVVTEDDSRMVDVAWKLASLAALYFRKWLFCWCTQLAGMTSFKHSEPLQKNLYGHCLFCAYISSNCDQWQCWSCAFYTHLHSYQRPIPTMLKQGQSSWLRQPQHQGDNQYLLSIQ
jgi:hypothetical protein